MPPTTSAPSTVRHFIDSYENSYVVHLSPHERAGGLGVSRNLNAVCFETEDGLWVGSVVVNPGVTLEKLTSRDLNKLLGIARMRHK